LLRFELRDGRGQEVVMLRKTSLRTVALLILGIAFPGTYLAAQETQDASSVAEAARRTREKKQAATKPTQVVTNDTLAPASGSAPAGANNAAAAPQSNASVAPAPEEEQSAEDEAAKAKDLEGLKQQIKEKEQSVALLRRELALAQDNFYRQPDYPRDTAGKQKLDSMQSDLKDGQAELDALKAKLADQGGAATEQPASANSPAAPAQPQN
jgi:hypothetical protein